MNWSPDVFVDLELFGDLHLLSFCPSVLLSFVLAPHRSVLPILLLFWTRLMPKLSCCVLNMWHDQSQLPDIFQNSCLESACVSLERLWPCAALVPGNVLIAAFKSFFTAGTCVCFTVLLPETVWHWHRAPGPCSASEYNLYFPFFCKSGIEGEWDNTNP